MNSSTAESIRPRDLATLLLASGELRVRQRARDQQADMAGLHLKRRILERLANLDPEPEDLDATLACIIDEIGAPTGPTRAIAISIREEWQAMSRCPELLPHLLGEAMRESGKEDRGRQSDK